MIFVINILNGLRESFGFFVNICSFPSSQTKHTNFSFALSDFSLYRFVPRVLQSGASGVFFLFFDQNIIRIERGHRKHGDLFLRQYGRDLRQDPDKREFHLSHHAEHRPTVLFGERPFRRAFRATNHGQFPVRFPDKTKIVAHSYIRRIRRFANAEIALYKFQFHAYSIAQTQEKSNGNMRFTCISGRNEVHSYSMKRAISFVLLLCFSILFLGCAERRPNEAFFFAMDTYFSLSVYGDEDVLDEAERLVKRIEDTLSVTDENSPTFRLNAEGVSEENALLASLASRCIELGILTGGAFDITVYPSVRAWGFTTDAHHVLTKEESDALLPFIGYDKISVSGNIVRLPEGTQVDFGGVAKGYCSDELVRLLRERGVESGVLSLGGNVYVLGQKPNGSKWKVAVNDPMGNGYVGVMEAEDKAVVTSGIYERYFEKDGVKYGHIIDPFTARPVESDLISVTVVGKSGTLCDALSTALFVMGADKAIAFLQTADVDAVLVLQDGSVRITPGLDGNFSAQGAYAGKTQVIVW